MINLPGAVFIGGAAGLAYLLHRTFTKGPLNVKAKPRGPMAKAAPRGPRSSKQARRRAPQPRGPLETLGPLKEHLRWLSNGWDRMDGRAKTAAVQRSFSGPRGRLSQLNQTDVARAEAHINYVIEARNDYRVRGQFVPAPNRIYTTPLGQVSIVRGPDRGLKIELS